MKLNNKGFAVSAILYSLLLVFVLFAIVVISSFDSSIDIVGASNDDIVNGNTFVVYETLIKNHMRNERVLDNDYCQSEGDTWYNTNCEKKIMIQTKNGTLYWPKDFCKEKAEGKCVKYGNVNEKEHLLINFTLGKKRDCDTSNEMYTTHKNCAVDLYNAYKNGEKKVECDSTWLSIATTETVSADGTESNNIWRPVDAGGRGYYNEMWEPSHYNETCTDSTCQKFYCAHVLNTLTKEAKAIHITDMCKDRDKREDNIWGDQGNRPLSYSVKLYVFKPSDNDGDDGTELKFDKIKREASSVCYSTASQNYSEGDDKKSWETRYECNNFSYNTITVNDDNNNLDDYEYYFAIYGGSTPDALNITNSTESFSIDKELLNNNKTDRNILDSVAANWGIKVNGNVLSLTNYWATDCDTEGGCNAGDENSYQRRNIVIVAIPVKKTNNSEPEPTTEEPTTEESTVPPSTTNIDQEDTNDSNDEE